MDGATIIYLSPYQGVRLLCSSNSLSSESFWKIVAPALRRSLSSGEWFVLNLDPNKRWTLYFNEDGNEYVTDRPGGNKIYISTNDDNAVTNDSKHRSPIGSLFDDVKSLMNTDFKKDNGFD
jgi:hypothetical protein